MTDHGREDLDVTQSDEVTLQCQQCGSTFAHPGGRGRRPTRCPECRRRRTPDTPAGAGKDSAPRRPAGIDKLQANLQTQLTMLGAAVAFVDPFDAKVIITKAEKGAKALANLAATNPKIRALLERGIETAGYGPVLLWGAEVALPILAHHGMLRGVPDPAKAPRPPAAPAGEATDGSI